MLMENIRRGAKKHRALMMIVVAGLCLSLLLGVIFTGGGRRQSEVTLAQQIAAYEGLVKDARDKLAESPKDYSASGSLGDLLMELSLLHKQNNAPEKTITAAAEAAASYETSLANAPEGLSKIGQARIVSKLAMAYEFAGNTESAESNFKKSLETGEHDWQVERGYIDYLFRKPDYAAALAYAQSLIGVYNTGTTELTELNNAIAYLGVRVGEEGMAK